MSYLLKEIREKFEDRIDPQINKFTALRILSKSLEEKGFNADDIQLLEALITDIVNKHGGSKEEVFRALYQGYRM